MNVDGKYIVKGDANCDQRITIDDIIAIQLDIFDYENLTGDAFTAADLNSDGKISTADAALLHQHLLGIRMITEVIDK